MSLHSIASAFRTCAFTAAVALVMATQSREFFGGVGIGEWAALSFILLTIGRAPATLTPLSALGFSIFLAGFLIGGAVNGVANLSPHFAAPDLAAIVFSIVFALCAVGWLREQPQPTRTLARGLTFAVFVQLVPLVALLLGVAMPAWLTDSEELGIPFASRYIGFSDNPNQLGLLLCAYPFVALAELRQAKSVASRVWLTLGLAAAAALAILVNSNTVFAAYILGCAAWVFLMVNRWPRARGLSSGRLTVSLVLTLCAAVLFAFYALASIEKTGDSDANGRFQRWHAAMDGLRQSALLGVGPGGQSGETGPFQGEEAHNFLLDVALQGGLISVAAYLALVVRSIRRAFAAGSMLMVCVLVAVLTQQVAHYTARQPLNWLYLLLPLSIARSAASRAGHHERAEAYTVGMRYSDRPALAGPQDASD